MILLRQSSLYGLARILPAVLGFAGIAIYTRFLDPASVGAYALVLSTVMLVGGLAFGWLRVAGFRMISGADEIEPDMARTLCSLFAATVLIVIAVEALALRLLLPKLTPLTFALTIAATIASSWFDFCTTVLQARMKVTAYGIFNLARAGLALPASLGLIFLGLKTDALLSGYLVGNLTILAATGMWRPALRGTFDRALVVSLFRFGWPNSVIAGLGQLSTTFQRYAIAAFAGASALGIFSVAGVFAQQAVTTLISCVAVAGQPLAFKARDRGDVAGLRKQLSENAQLIFGLALPCGVALAALAGPVSQHFLGAKFQTGAALIMGLIAISAMIEGIRSAYFDQAFEIALKMRPLTVIAVTYASLLALFSLLLIPRYGAIGAAVATVGAHALETLLSALWGRRIVEMPIPVGSILKTVAATTGMVLVLRLFPEHDSLPGLIASIVLGGATYLAISTATRLRQVRAHLGHSLTWLPLNR